MNKSIAVRTFIFEGKLHSKWSVLGTALLCHPSAQTLGSSFPYNLIENVVTTFYASLLAHKQTFLDPSVWALG
ncbi:hypothetical protein [Wolbachia endosymbiont (group A) of Pogonocherus hispidulus]|uniref:hypothetical protein n=1 Tax=Wolbachia endosymbiont (group A) of Pogonocherus hispidulus TaxID=3066136 RepID=UPI0033413CC0